jgi:hypothetical protein
MHKGAAAMLLAVRCHQFLGLVSFASTCTHEHDLTLHDGRVEVIVAGLQLNSGLRCPVALSIKPKQQNARQQHLQLSLVQ